VQVQVQVQVQGNGLWALWRLMAHLALRTYASSRGALRRFDLFVIESGPSDFWMGVIQTMQTVG
jgi:hypothetical protein